MLSILDKIGMCVVSCKRYFVDHSNVIPSEIYDQESDGLTLLEFDDGNIYLFYGKVEEDIIRVEETDNTLLLEGGMNPLSFTDVSENDFWGKRLNQPIIRVEELFFKGGALPYGVKFYLQNELNFSVEYHWETEFDSETTVIRGD